MNVNRINSGVNLDRTNESLPAKPATPASSENVALNLTLPASSNVNQAAIKSGVAVNKGGFQTSTSSNTSKGITHFQKSQSLTKSKDLAGTIKPEEFPANPYGSLGGFPLAGSQPNIATAGFNVSKEAGGGVIYANGKVIAGPSYGVLANVDIKNYGAILGAQAKYGVDAGAEAGYQRNIGTFLNQQIGVNVRANATGFVGAEAVGAAELSFKGGPKFQVGGEVFTGARARLQGTTGLRVNNSEVGSVRAGVEGWAGVGVKGDIDISFKNGKLDFDVEAGAALGLGGSVDFGGSIDILGAIRAYQNSSVGRAISSTVSAVAAGAEKVATVVGNKLAAAGNAVVSWVKSIF
jgi:hypothetical protein